MKCNREMMQLYAITDRSWLKNQTLEQQVEYALKGGVTCVQIREKNLDNDLFLKEAIKIREICNTYKIPFIVNDNIEVAVKSNADGIHIGQDDGDIKDIRKILGNDKIIGVSVQNIEQAIIAEKNGASYLGVGAIFKTETKPDAKYVSLEQLKLICENVLIPVVAIGGINKSNIMDLAKTKVDGVAMISQIFSAQNIEKECMELLKLSKEMLNL